MSPRYLRMPPGLFALRTIAPTSGSTPPPGRSHSLGSSSAHSRRHRFGKRNHGSLGRDVCGMVLLTNESHPARGVENDFKSAQFLIRGLVEVASRGGSFLLNVGPRPDGTIQPEFQERLRAIGDWLSVNGDSIYGTIDGPIQGLESVRTTAKDNKIFVHVFDWPASSPQVSGIKPKIFSAGLL